jgi:acyl-CoA synthetase (AMP-forming)/AMP-acid ligase II
MLAELNRKYNGDTGPFLSALAVVNVDDIPMGATGKVLKRELREKFKNFLTDPAVRNALSADIALG